MPRDKRSDYDSVVHAEQKFGLRQPPGPPLPPTGGGGTYDGMEARVARLEADVGHIKADIGEIKQTSRGVLSDLSALRVDFGRLDERVKVLPTKAFIGTSLVGGVAFLIAALTLFSRLGWLVAGAPK